MSRQISLVVTDLDGTFWYHDHSIDPAVVSAVAAVEEAGVELLVATGRRLNSTRRPLAAVGLRPPAIVLNGALGIDLATDQRFHVGPFKPTDAAAVLGAFRAVGLDPVIYIDDPDTEAFVSSTPSTNPGHIAMLEPNLVVDDLDRVVAEESVLGFSLIGVQHGSAVAAQNSIGALADSHLDRSIDFPGFATFTVAPNDQSKWDGVKVFCELRGLDPANVLALGDGTNDLELLENAAVSLVPSVAHPAVLELADHVIPAAKDGGWVAVLDHI